MDEHQNVEVSGNDDSDKELFIQCRKGSEDAYRKLYERFSKKIYTFCLRLLGNMQEAEDTLQETFLHVVQNAASFRFESRVSTWIYNIARNACYDRLRRRKKFLFFSLDERLPESFTDDNAGNALESVEIKGDVQRALQKLSPVDRTLLIAREILGLSYEEIGGMMQWKEGTVKSRLHHARMLFSRHYQRSNMP